MRKTHRAESEEEMDIKRKKELQAIAREVRKDVLTEVYRASSGHPGGSLSSADILTFLYFEAMKIDPADPRKENRDRFVLSKGHAAPGLYAALCERGFFPKEELNTLRQLGSILQGHPDMEKTPGVDISTGSLGQGLSNACGMALAAKLKKADYKVYAITGDGELQEGQIWESAMFAAHYKLDNLIVFSDVNGLQIDGRTADVMNPEPVDKKFEAFGWHVQRINGHDFDEIEAAWKKALEVKGQPHAIVCDTVKGKGVSFMENKAGWHGKAPKAEEYEQAMKELDEGKEA